MQALLRAVLAANPVLGASGEKSAEGVTTPRRYHTVSVRLSYGVVCPGLYPREAVPLPSSVFRGTLYSSPDDCLGRLGANGVGPERGVASLLEEWNSWLRGTRSDTSEEMVVMGTVSEPLVTLAFTRVEGACGK